MGDEDDKGTILVVDDAMDTLEILQRNLTLEGHRVFTAQSVAGALKILETAPVDLVITDIKMPDVSGHDLIRHIRENRSDTEVVVITGYPRSRGRERGENGRLRVLPKPFTDIEAPGGRRQGHGQPAPAQEHPEPVRRQAGRPTA